MESKNCGAGIKVGHKHVFGMMPNTFLVDESDCPLCMKALGPICELTHGFWERIFEGLDPNEGMGLFSNCLDRGLNYGGLGHVVFGVYAEKVA